MKKLEGYNIDLIAKRDRENALRSSVIKRWNVRMEEASEEIEEVKEEQEAPRMTEEEAKNARIAQEIIDRLNREAAEDEAIKQAEIDAAMQQSAETFNVTTGSNSGAYGLGEVSEDDKAVVDSIMAEKGDALQDLIAKTAAENQ